MQPVPSSPQMWSRFSQWPISWVAVRPRLNGAAAVPVVPKAVSRMTTPSVCGRPARELRVAEQVLPSRQTQRFRYRSAGQASCPPVAGGLHAIVVGKGRR